MTKFEHDQLVLHSPFDPDVHSKTFIAYCEVIIWPDGKIEYAVPSHSEKLLEAYGKVYNLDRQTSIETISMLTDFNFFDYIMKDTGIAEVWYNSIYNVVPLTKAQKEAISTLISKKCVSDELLRDII